jgi:hypothetical protein
MKYQNVQKAIDEASEFITKASDLLVLTDREGENNLGTVIQGSLSASVRRASHDLSRTLSRMRKSDWAEEDGQ